MKYSYLTFLALQPLPLAVAQFEGASDGIDGITSLHRVDPFDPRHPIVKSDALRGSNRKLGPPDKCDPEEVILSDYPQWVAEEGYWVGEYSFYGPEGDAYTSESWPYRYDHYRGFITGATNGRCYRQRNVFMYPGQGIVKGTKTKTLPGNTKIFEADQRAETCSDNPELGGDISGPFGPFDTYTSLVGEADNAVLYQVYYPIPGVPGPGLIFQSQLTTLNTNTDGTEQRTRTAQGFDLNTGAQSYASFYRERKVSKEEFYELFRETQNLYLISDDDLCATDGFGYPTGNSGFDFCESHLEESFNFDCESELFV